MSASATHSEARAAAAVANSGAASRRGFVFGAAAVSLIVGSALVAGFAPLGFSMAIVALFAGPHNWFEARYFLSRMPPRWGRLRLFFYLGLSGTVLLSAFFWAMPVIYRHYGLDLRGWMRMSSAWNTMILLWAATLTHLRGKEGRGRDWSWVWGPALALVAVVWIWPRAWDLALVYLHNIIALVFLARVVKRKRPQWVSALRWAYALVPLAVVVLYLRLGHAPNLPGDSALALRISTHAGADLLGGLSTHFLVALHTFLQMLHYGVWVAAIPVVTRAPPWKVRTVPLSTRGRRWRQAIVLVIVGGAVACLALWGGFIANYPWTRELYFTLAMLHVLAEVPFFLRTL